MAERKPQKPYVSTVRKLKSAGVARDDAGYILRKSIEEAAKRDEWRPSVRAMALVSADDALTEVYGAAK